MLGIQVVREERGEERVVSEFAIPDDQPIDEVLRVLELEHGDDIETIVSLVEKDRWGDSEDPSPDARFDVPEENEEVRDLDSPSWAEDSLVYVTEVTDTKAADYEIQPDDAGLGDLFNPETVHDRNPAYSADAPVVIGRYLDGSGTEYAFPADRLERLRPNA